jgi:hypothetical protein
MVDTHQGRDMSTHFTVVAVVNLVFAIPAILFGAFVFLAGLIGGGAVGAFSDVPAVGGLVAGAGIVVGLGIIALAIPAIVAGVGLLKRTSWAKPWTIGAAVLHLINVPIGTAFGIYALWAMLQPETDRALGRPTSAPQRP